MKKTLYALLTLLLLSMGSVCQAQNTDSRNRTPQTVVTDGLAQLPAPDMATYNQIMGEIARTGATGVNLLTGMLRPASQADNSRAEYALNGVVNYVSAKGQEALVPPIHDALIAALSKCTDDPNRAFILSQLNKITDKGDFQLYKGLLNDSYLAGEALNGLAHMPGIDAEVVEMIKSSEPSAPLAYLAYFRKLQGVEPVLIKWAASADPAVKRDALNALAVCGSAASVKTLRNSGDTDAYLQLLSNLGTDKSVVSEAKALIKTKGNEPLRCAGLLLLLQSDPKSASKTILAALKDPSDQFRHTALINAIPAAGEGIVAAVAAKYKGLPIASQIDVMRWLGNNHCQAQLPLIISAIGSKDEALKIAAIESASKIGGDNALQAILPELGAPGAVGEAAAKSLLTFNGNISQGVMSSLASSDPAVLKAALALASARHINAAFPTVVSLTKSTDAAVAEAACKALDGVAAAKNFNEVCQLMNTSTGAKTPLLQKAAMSAIAPLSADEQFNAASKLMESAKSPALYYPLLAQSGTQKAVSKLMEAFKGSDSKAAFDALLKVNNPAQARTILRLAGSVKGDERDQALKRYVALIGKTPMNPQAAYSSYNSALNLKPGAAVTKQLLSAISRYPSRPAALLAAKYMSDAPVAFAAANSFATIIKADNALQSGDEMKGAAEEALKVFAAEKAKGNADAGYSIDMLKGILDKWNNADDPDAGKPMNVLTDEEKAQGFELLFDGKSMDNFHGNTTAYIPQDGCIYVTAQYGGTGNLYTKKNYSDFFFRFDFFFDVPAVNNGIGIRTGKNVTGVDAAYEGMEIQVLDHDDPVYQGHNYNYAGLRPYQNHGSVYGIYSPKHIDFGPIKQWHTEEIRAIGDHIVVTVDGEVVTDVNIREATQGHNVAPDGGKNPYTLDHKNHPGLFNKEGYISFCGHGQGVKFRNIRVLDLTTKQGKKVRAQIEKGK